MTTTLADDLHSLHRRPLNNPSGYTNPFMLEAELEAGLTAIVSAVDMDRPAVDYILSELSSGADKETPEKRSSRSWMSRHRAPSPRRHARCSNR